MIAIDLPADVHFEDDSGLVLARVDRADHPEAIAAGTILVAGTADAWIWAEVVLVEDGWAQVQPLTSAQAAAKANLVTPLSGTA